MAGLYTRVIPYDIPASLPAGETYQIKFFVKNTSIYYGSFSGMGYSQAQGNAPLIALPTTPGGLNLQPGEQALFTSTLIMPAVGITFWAYSQYYDEDGTWHFDDSFSKNIGIGAQAGFPTAAVIAGVALVMIAIVALPEKAVTSGRRLAREQASRGAKYVGKQAVVLGREAKKQAAGLAQEAKKRFKR